MRTAHRVDYFPEFSERQRLTGFCDLAMDQRGATWYLCVVSTCGFAIRMDNSNFDSPAAVKVHYRASHLPINYRK